MNQTHHRSKPPQSKLFVEGRYKKLTRDLPQTVFFCPECKGHPRRRKGCDRCEGFGKLTRDSVQELIGWVLGSEFKTRKNKFHGAGREDVDVRMLGTGRPFVMEMVAPKVLDVDLAAAEAEINRRNEGRMEVHGLHWSEKSRIRVIKESPHAKTYQALIQVEGAIDPAKVQACMDMGRTVIAQETPSRVAHRRAEKTRERWIEIEALDSVEGAEDRLLLRMKTQHGTYVKEAVTGEAGSTKPSITGLLGVPCRCLELDVVGILNEDGSPQEITPRREQVFGAEI
ncbi:MAG: tRNA pseudouridine(54/55) synthase Pus10 [Planctomycetota bacterium]